MDKRVVGSIVTAAAAGLVFSVAAPAAFAAAVTIREPAFDLPHVCADTDLNAARQQGFEAARDRIGQFLLVMNVARGTLHRALGNLGVPADDDIETRRMGYSRSEYASMYNHLPAEARDIILAYCEGVNDAIGEMLRQGGTLDAPLELRLFKQVFASANNLFGNRDPLTKGEGPDPFYQPPGPSLPGGFQFTPEIALSFAVLQIRNFGYEAWDEIGMAEDLAKLVAVYGPTVGAELWDDRYWKNDPLQPVSVPDPRTPGFGGPLSKRTRELDLSEQIEVAKAVRRIEDRIKGRVRLPGYPMHDYTKALEPVRLARAAREWRARQWGAWPSLGSYAMMIAPGRSATGNPWIGGFPQTGIQVPSLMHYSEIRGDKIRGNGMVFVGGPYALIGHTDNVAYTSTTAMLKIVDTYIEQLVSGNFDLFKYNHHGTVEEMAKRIELVYKPNGGVIEVPVFRTNVVCSANGCTKGDRPVEAFAGDVAGTVDAATATSVTDADASFTPGALAGGYVAIVDGTGAGQMREIASNTGDTLVVAVAWTTTPDETSEYVAVGPGGTITAITRESPVWLEEGLAAVGWSLFQQAQSVMDMRSAVRLIPSTHNFIAADNQPFNGVGTDTGTGNILYATSGFHRVRQNGVDSRLPLDGAAPEPFAVLTGTVSSATANSLTDPGAFTGRDLAASPINYTYDHPDDNGSDYIVMITAGNGYHQVRRILSNTNDTITVEHDWGVVPSPGDTYAVYEIWAMPEAMNPAEGFTANWNNKQAVANDVMLSKNGRNHRVEVILEQLSLDDSITREDLRALNKYVAGVTDPGTPGRYLMGRVQQALAAYGDCGTIDDELIAATDFPERGREITDPLVVPPAGKPVSEAVASKSADYIKGWATELAAAIYGDEYGPAGVSLLTWDKAIGWVLHAIDAAAGDVPGAYVNKYSGDYFNGADWKQVVHDSFCSYVAAHPTIGTKNRPMRTYNHPLAALPCQQGCSTPIEFDPTPLGNRGTWEEIIEVGPTVTGEFIFPLGQSGNIEGQAIGFGAANIKTTLHTATLQPVWRDWRFLPMLHVCEDVQFGIDEDGDTDDDGVLDGFEKWYYGDLSNSATSDTDGDGADLATEYRWGSDPTVADTDGDTVPDGNDVAPQDRLCVRGRLKKLGVKDKPQPGKDKVVAKWEAPLHVCLGGDFKTPCQTDSDCGPVGLCRQIHLNPSREPIRVLAADDSPLLDVEIPESRTMWKNKKDAVFTYRDKEAVNGPIFKMKVRLNAKKDLVQILALAKKFDLGATPDAAEGVAGIAFGTRCFMEPTTNCKQKAGVLSCKSL